ncbi:restriction endonuclease subunit S [Lactobacillus delbrueckii]|nr:restriction endonuclease subunit S [Lactobacillus delbrueckii]MCZ0788829.1 restriction endonuclease subunit S [Lactobacillus delbrueckii subsp. sunkii]
MKQTPWSSPSARSCKNRRKECNFAWEQCKLGDVCEEVSGNNGNVKGLPILTISAANGWMNQKDRFSQVIAGNELKKYTLLEKGHLAYNHGNSKLAKYGTVFVQNLYDQALVPRVYHSFKMKTENNPYYVEYYFATKKLDRELARLVTSGARMDGLLNINKKDFFKIKFEVPTPVEQSLISTILQKLDQIITLHEEKKQQLKCLKSALLQKMFANKSGYPAVRFERFSNEWEQCKLGDVANFSKGTGYSKSDLKRTGSPIILYGCLYTKYETIIRNVDTFVVPKSGSVFSKGGEVIVPGSGETAEDISIASVVEPTGILLGGDLNIIYPNSDLDPTFLAITISHGKPHFDMARRAQGKSIVHLHNADLKHISLKTPNLSEQKRISKIFEVFDQTITLHDQKLSLLKRVKQTLLQKMFI